MPEDFGSSTIDSYIYSICANYTAAEQEKPITLIGNPYMFTARRYDIETGLYYYRARYYNPYIGRFLQKDPAYQGMNWYAYCRNNTLNCTDPSGLISSLYDPRGIAQVIMTAGVDQAVFLFGTDAVAETIGMSTAMTAAANIALWSSIYSDLSSSNVPGPCVPGPCNVTVRLSSSFEEIVNYKDLFKRWTRKSSYLRSRPYIALEALWIYHRLEQWMGGPPEIHPPERGWFWHFKWNGKHIPISLEAYELLKKLFGE